MPGGRVAIGDDLYLFSNYNGAQNRTRLMITAHGEQVFMGNTFNRTFKVPGASTLNFFAPHGNNLDTTFAKVALATNRNGAIVEQINGGLPCYNYNLTKFQGYHTKGLTGVVAFDKLIDTCYHGQRGLSYDDIITCVEDPFVDVDVLTVRNRILARAITLEKTLQELANSGYNYNDIYCSFCRGPAWTSWRTVANCGTPDTRH